MQQLTSSVDTNLISFYKRAPWMVKQHRWCPSLVYNNVVHTVCIFSMDKPFLRCSFCFHLLPLDHSRHIFNSISAIKLFKHQDSNPYHWSHSSISMTTRAVVQDGECFTSTAPWQCLARTAPSGGRTQSHPRMRRRRGHEPSHTACGSKNPFQRVEDLKVKT